MEKISNQLPEMKSDPQNLEKNLGEIIVVEDMISLITRVSDNLIFLKLSGGIQCVITDAEYIENIDEGDFVEVEGLVQEKISRNNEKEFEILVNNVKKENENSEKFDYKLGRPLNISLDNKLSNRIITLRNNQERAITNIYSSIHQAFVDFCYENGFKNIVAPSIVKGSAESGSAMFEVPYYEDKAYLSQSPQFYKQAGITQNERVFNVGPAFRAEKSNTNRHLTEYQSLDMEMRTKHLEELLSAFYGFYQKIFEVIEENNLKDLDVLKIKELPDSSMDFPTISFDEAKNIAKKMIRDKDLIHNNEEDLSPEEERMIVKHAIKNYKSNIIAITDYPFKKRPFYVRRDEENQNSTKSFDVLFGQFKKDGSIQGSEIVTGGLREYRLDKLIENIKEKGLDMSGLEDYLDLYRYGLPSHGGMGIGSERVLQHLLLLNNVQEARAFPRTRNRIT